ncbi:type II secretion system F family protein [Streptomyces sp. TRM66268-LWL]|uniref:Type II secretion system F family protein n=1 Tax=Streptomyces polyasparticus TaxID=2767826 RepID=A0ABR7SUR2_9ACTN|nr:type II secretion system F family protein [Streptomyces polyasparticus]MBC9718013.1 type II secretion system F family protein [Streptomyces polyasparticus]
MTTTRMLIGLALGCGFAACVGLFVLALRGGPRVKPRLRGRLPADVGGRSLLIAGAVAVTVGIVTGWPVAALLTFTGVLTLPRLLGGDRQAAARTERLEAIATWTEMLRDTLSAAAGLEQAILATVPVAPPALKVPAEALAARIEDGAPLADALRAFADEVDDPVADMAVAALVMAAERQARQLAPLLGALAQSTREQVVMRLRTEAGRARVRTSVRVITATTLGLAAGLVVLNRPYLGPYGTGLGQLVLGLVGALFGVGLWWLAKIATLGEESRVLKGVATSGAGGGGR